MTFGDYGYFIEVEGGFKLIPCENVSLEGGYRFLDVKAQDDPDFAKFELSGPFVSAVLRF